MEIRITSEEIIKLPGTAEIDNETPLTISDLCQARMYVKTCYFYKNSTATPFSVDRMIAGLKTTLKEYPEICGSIKYTTTGGILHHDNHGVKIIKSKANFSFAEVENINFEVKKLPEKEIFPFEVREFPLNNDAYLLVAQIISLNDESLILVVNYHHLLCDRQGICNFLSAWAHATTHGDIGVFSNITNRYLLQQNVHYERKNQYKHLFLSSISSHFVITAKTTKLRLYVPFSKLNSLQMKFSKILGDSVYISKNDVLTGIIWKATVAARMHKKCESSMAAIVVNCRKTFGLPNNYFRNGISYLCMRLSTAEILDMPIEEVCLRLRQNYDFMSKSYILEFLHSLFNQISLPIFPSIVHNDILLTSLAHYSLYDFDFGLGKAIGVSTVSKGTPGFVTILPTPHKDGLFVEFCLETEEMSIFLKNDYVKETFTIVY
ncbi:uncharacterized protein LOC130647511 isoform X2 [Hydractinia symbiolongicarpus]|nr:uncharacterized protein LOC130647511 isoform X2 [Hydractinia symbiolongicarpus]XP_057309373.1 uncharacterized protein LOC130647511 isoform X2 [Hydractinia symbiolongicarpus]